FTCNLYVVDCSFSLLLFSLCNLSVCAIITTLQFHSSVFGPSFSYILYIAHLFTFCPSSFLYRIVLYRSWLHATPEKDLYSYSIPCTSKWNLSSQSRHA